MCIEDLPEDIPANDPRVDLIVKSLFKIDEKGECQNRKVGKVAAILLDSTQE